MSHPRYRIPRFVLKVVNLRLEEPINSFPVDFISPTHFVGRQEAGLPSRLR